MCQSTDFLNARKHRESALSSNGSPDKTGSPNSEGKRNTYGNQPWGI